MSDLPNLMFERIPRNAVIVAKPNYYIAIVNNIKHIVIMEGNKQIQQQKDLDRRAKKDLHHLSKYDLPQIVR